MRGTKRKSCYALSTQFRKLTNDAPPWPARRVARCHRDHRHLAAILFPVFAKAEGTGHSCLSSFRQMSLAAFSTQVTMRCVINRSGRDGYSHASDLDQRCPSRRASLVHGPGCIGVPAMLGTPVPELPGRSEGTVRRQAGTILMAGGSAATRVRRRAEALRGRDGCWTVCRIHSSGSNVAFCDAHAKWMRPDDYH